MATIHNKTVRRAIGACAGCLLVNAACLSPSAAAAEDCSPDGLAGTLASTTTAARGYLNAHPDADAAVTTAEGRPRPQAAATLRAYFTAHPGEYFDLRGILAPIGDAQRQYHTTLLPPELASAYDEFMAG